MYINGIKIHINIIIYNYKIKINMIENNHTKEI